jgi:integrase
MQSPRHAFSTELSHKVNLRAHELLTLRRAEELQPSAHRPWRTDLFSFVGEHVLYSCTGKGGLDRHVAIPKELAEKLEKFRLPKGTELLYIDRKVKYKCFYDVSGGQAFSQAFTTSAQKALGFSNGAHGLRHSYAQKRLATLKMNGFDTQTSLLILSQELGHFRPEIVLAYLR